MRVRLLGNITTYLFTVPIIIEKANNTSAVKNAFRKLCFINFYVKGLVLRESSLQEVGFMADEGGGGKRQGDLFRHLKG